jgi:hypothetical protein
MVTYGGMSKKPVTVSTSAFIFKVSSSYPAYMLLYKWYSSAALSINTM